MIEVTFYKNDKNLCGFKAINHGKDIICSAISILTQNTVNSIEAFTGEEFSIEYEPEGGYMEFILKPLDDKFDKDAMLLMNSLYLGVKSISDEYGGEVRIFIKEVPQC